MSATTAELVSYEDPSVITERVAVGGFLAGYTGDTRTDCTTDLRIFRRLVPHQGAGLARTKPPRSSGRCTVPTHRRSVPPRLGRANSNACSVHMCPSPRSCRAS